MGSEPCGLLVDLMQLDSAENLLDQSWVDAGDMLESNGNVVKSCMCVSRKVFLTDQISGHTCDCADDL